MIRHLKGVLFGLAALALASCGAVAPVGDTQNTQMSAREQARQVQDVYLILLTTTDAAMSTGKLSAKIQGQIAAVSQEATNAEHAYVDEAKKCWRDQTTGIEGDAPGLPEGQHCNPSAIQRLLSVFTMKTGSLQGTLAAFGIDTSKAGEL